MRLFRGDALAVLRDLPDASVDAVITDPPYSSGGFTRGDRTDPTISKYGNGDSGRDLADFAGDNRDQRGFTYWCALWLSECLRVVKPTGVVMLFCDWRQLPATTDAIQAGGWMWRGIIPWSKPAGSTRSFAGRFTASCEYVIWGSRGQMDLLKGVTSLPGFYEMPPPRGESREHITQKPLTLMRSLVQIVPVGGVVLDPFMGSGTTGVAAVLEGRQFIGVELTEHYYRVAAERIGTAERGYRTPAAQLVLGAEEAS